MRDAALVGAFGLLAACDELPGQPSPIGAPPGREAAFVALVEQSDCRFDPMNHPAFHEAGFDDPEMRAIGSDLIASGQAEMDANGVLVLTSGNCV